MYVRNVGGGGSLRLAAGVMAVVMIVDKLW